MADVLKLSRLSADQVPKQLKSDYYFDLEAHPFAHASLLREAKSVIQALSEIGPGPNLNGQEKKPGCPPLQMGHPGKPHISSHLFSAPSVPFPRRGCCQPPSRRDKRQ